MCVRTFDIHKHMHVCIQCWHHFSSQVTDSEPQRAHLKVTVPCGRTSETAAAPGAMAIGARTMQEGGALLGWSREQVHLFFRILWTCVYCRRKNSAFFCFNHTCSSVFHEFGIFQGGSCLLFEMRMFVQDCLVHLWLCAHACTFASTYVCKHTYIILFLSDISIIHIIRIHVWLMCSCGLLFNGRNDSV